MSTRGHQTATLDEALTQGIAGDGGLFVPEQLPHFDITDFDGADSIGEVARILMAPFFRGSRLEAEIEPILAETFGFTIPLRRLPGGADSLWLLELFHGPTAAFKDVGAGFLAACLSRLESGRGKPLTILVATSGDTGGAVAAAFDARPGMQVAVLWPEGRVSERQAQQLACWSDNVLSLAVQGSFDDCQTLVKAAMADRGFRNAFRLSSANSINIGRLLPQCTYYAWASLARFRESGRKPGFVVPTGNLGNGLACLLARAMGLPVGRVILATNANRLVADWLEGAEWIPRRSQSTLATAMDVGNPSNMERLMRLFGDRDAVAANLQAWSADDEAIAREIRNSHAQFGVAMCPHTATAIDAWRHLGERERQAEDWIAVATAHAAKFEQVVEPLIGESVDLPDALREILGRPAHFVRIEPTLPALMAAMNSGLRLDGAAAARDK
jgi:threonine synthase